MAQQDGTPSSAQVAVISVAVVASFAAILSIGVIAGGITYIATYLEKK
jgi:nucleoside permease NupC